VATYDLVRELPLEIEDLSFEGLELALTKDFVRYTTLVTLRGGGEEGVGEDVAYDGLDQANLQASGSRFDLSGSYTLESFSAKLEEVGLFPDPPVRENSVDFRRWAFESAALDLALRQAGRSLADVLGRDPRPLTYVVSMRLAAPGEKGPETTEKVDDLLARYPGLRFKLDPTNTWTDDLIERLRDSGAVDSLDLKGFYRGTPVDVETDPVLYRKLAETFPDAWLEDADLTEETTPILEPHRDRLTWDAPIHSIADIEERLWKPRMVNIKPSRFGPLKRLFDTYDYCDAEGIRAYGGGQSELGVGRDHIQYLASLFHPDTPNDTAPREFNRPEVPDGLPRSPLDLEIAPTGFRFG
jgi:hypothetical protein